MDTCKSHILSENKENFILSNNDRKEISGNKNVGDKRLLIILLSISCYLLIYA